MPELPLPPHHAALPATTGSGTDRREFLRIVLLSTVALSSSLSGCGSHSGILYPINGSARILIDWPSRRTAVPSATAYILILLTKTSDSAFHRTIGPIARPDSAEASTTTIEIADLPPGDIVATVESFPADQMGVRLAPLAVGVINLVVKSGTSATVRATLNSTIDHIEVQSAGVPLTTDVVLKVGKHSTLNAVARSNEGAVILVNPSKWKWSTDSTAVSLIATTPPGSTITINGLTASQAGNKETIVVQDTESGKSAVVYCTVKAVPANSFYTITYLCKDIGVLNESGKLNNTGEVTLQLGEANNSGSLYTGIFRDGTITPVNLPATLHGNSPLALNDRSQLLISQLDAVYRLYLWENGASTLLPMPYQRFEYFFGGAMNNIGEIVGQVATEFNETGLINTGQFAYYWKDGNFQVIGPSQSAAVKINDAGQIVGLVDTPGVAGTRKVVLWPKYDSPYIEVEATGDIVAFANDGTILFNLNEAINGSTCAFWIPDQPNGITGKLHSIPVTVSLPNSNSSSLPGGFGATDMNNSRDVVGTAYATYGTGADDSAVPLLIRYGNTSPINLNALLEPDSGWELHRTISINDKGQITGTGWYTDDTGNRQKAIFLMTPPAN